MSYTSGKKFSYSPGDIWQKFLDEELKSKSKLGEIFKVCSFGSYDDKSRTLILFVPDENISKSARGQVEKVKSKLKNLGLTCDRIDCTIGKPIMQKTPVAERSSIKKGNPLQSLIYTHFGVDPKNGKELSKPVLDAASNAEKTCQNIYTRLTERTKLLVEKDGVTLTIDFNWRLRVGGTQGFHELLLPVFHPVFGVPYIPASTLKGATRGWAKNSMNQVDTQEVLRILGILEGKESKQTISAKVQFLDAFPVEPSLTVDVATPQWTWKNDKVVYKAEPHFLLSQETPKYLIGLCPTSRGNGEDVKIVKNWLENALKAGIGSRVSSGYGRALGQAPLFPHSSTHNFELWTQGMYGGNTSISEFRPTALRGILRYWFRSIALSLYSSDSKGDTTNDSISECQNLEDEIFGNLSKPGKVLVSTIFNPPSEGKVYYYNGKICLEAKEKKYLLLLENLLILASHLGGFGRGSRRPLHLLNNRMRGCHWVINQSNLPLEYDLKQWQNFFENLINICKQVQPSTQSYTSNPGYEPRYQDVLDVNCQVWLLKSKGQIHPENVKNWQSEDHLIRGSGLSLLYANPKFKGESQGIGNSNVGGKFGIPSYVWIKSVFPNTGDPYQVLTIFGVDQDDRRALAEELHKLQTNNEAILVFGNISSDNKGSAKPQPNKPQLKPKK